MQLYERETGAGRVELMAGVAGSLCQRLCQSRCFLPHTGDPDSLWPARVCFADSFELRLLTRGVVGGAGKVAVSEDPPLEMAYLYLYKSVGPA